MQKQQYQRHVKNALDAIEAKDTDIAKRQIDIAIRAYERNALIRERKGQETEKPQPQHGRGRDAVGLQHSTARKESSNMTSPAQAKQNSLYIDEYTDYANSQQGLSRAEDIKQKLIITAVIVYVITLIYAVWLNLEFVADLGYGTSDQWLMIWAELAQAIFMVAGLHWWLGARGYEFPIAIGVFSFSVWMFIDRLIIAGQYSRAAEQLQAVKQAAIENLYNFNFM